MKNKIKILPLVTFAIIMLGFNSCEDEKMEWGHDYGGVEISEMPLDLAEKLANYDYIKAYAEQYAPHMSVGLGLDASLYISDTKYRKVVDDNFQIYTAGNEMKHSSIVRDNGDFDFTTIDRFFAAVPAGKAIYGHNFVWHQQQRASYLNRLIAPVPIPPTAGANMVDLSGLEDGTFTGWSRNNADGITIEQGKGLGASDPAIKFVVTAAGDEWSTQLTSPEFDAIVGNAHSFSFWIRSEENDDVSFRVSFGNMSNNYPWYDGAALIPTSSTWTQITYGADGSLKATGTPIKMAFDMGKKPGTYYIDLNTIKVVDLDAPAELSYVDISGLQDGSFTDWDKANNADGISIEEGKGLTATEPALKFVVDAAGDEWSTQLKSPEISLVAGNAYSFSFWIRSEEDDDVSFRVSFANMSNNYPWYDGAALIPTSSAWKQVIYGADGSFTASGTPVRMAFDMGKKPGTYYIDINSIKVLDVSTPNNAPALRASIDKTDEEKKEIILGELENWIKTMAGYCKDRVSAWDVLNEVVTDGASPQLRGVDGNIPAEVGDDHFYWGQYIGKEYGVKAFQFARQYGNPTDKLFINDYNLETNPNKLSKVIEYVNYIDATNGSPIVDGIGSQMHVDASSITKDQVDAMFRTMAATGKLVRVTELDVKLGTATPSVEQLEQQAEVYQMIVKSYFENVPKAQQSGITVWTLTDNKREHEYWLTDESPNLFDANYGRKHAYKTFCDAIAGYDISTDFDGEDYVKIYEEEEEDVE